jgi:hypothetical protein
MTPLHIIQQALLVLVAWLKTELEKDPVAAASAFKVLYVRCETEFHRQKMQDIGLPTLKFS